MNDVNKTEDMSIVQAGSNGVETAVPCGAGVEQGEVAAVTAADILGSMFAPEDMVCFRVFDDKKGGTFPGMKLECKCRDYLQEMEPQLRKHNEMGRGVFFVVNSGGHTDDAITRINAQFVEMDDGTFAEQWEKINSFPLPPSMVIQTRKSLHVYWFMEKGKAGVGRFREIQKLLVRWFDGDPACVNESRVMRLLGFYHNKTDTPVMVRCVCFHPERRYTQEQLLAVLPEPEESKPAQTAHKCGAAKGAESVMRGCQFMQHSRDNAANLSEPLWHAMITNLAQFGEGREMIHKLSEPYPGYTSEETDQKINNFLNSGTGPMTCEKICERGFKCPKFAQGGCGVKSPAALCFKPLDTEDLLEILGEQPVTGDPLKDVKTAGKFIEDYLYNQSRAIAEVMINDTVREYFRLKPGIAKALFADYRKASKMSAIGGRDGSAFGEKNLPKWYEPSEFGDPVYRPGLLAQYLAKEQSVFYRPPCYYQYEGGPYRQADQDRLRRLIQEKMLPRYTRITQITDTEEQLRLQINKDSSAINPNPHIINLRNGLYNIEDGTLSPHTMEYLSTVQLPVNYDENAECPKFIKFLTDAMCGDSEQVALIQEILGYILIPVTKAQKSFLFAGAPAAGKSVLLHVVKEILLGHENVSHISWQSLNDRFSKAELDGKLANIFADLPTKNIEDNGIFKSVVGGDYVTAEEKFKKPKPLLSTARMIFSCNCIPRNYGDRSEGFYRRLLIISFNRTVPEKERDPDLLDKFRAEADGIFMFALKGLKRLKDKDYNFSVTQTNIDALRQYREESDSVLSFVKDCCTLTPDKAIGSTELYHIYRAYCEESGMKAYSQKTFVQQLTVAYPDVTRAKDTIGRRRVLKGIVRADEFCDDDLEDLDDKDAMAI